jgi:hypothetical protein
VERELRRSGVELHAISAVTGEGVAPLVGRLCARVGGLR